MIALHDNTLKATPKDIAIADISLVVTPLTTNMLPTIVILLSLWTKLSMCREYRQVTEIMEGGKMILNWEVEDETFLFKLSGLTRGYIGLAFSYNDLPADGFIAGVDGEGHNYDVALHLDHAGKKEE